MLTGYLHPDYAGSFVDLGTPRLLPGSQGWVVTRDIRGTGHHDAMGCYPLFCCADWHALSKDLGAINDGLVSVVLVADPLGDHSHELLATTFDHLVAFKEHFVIETGRAPQDFVSASHRAHARRAVKDVTVDVCPDPSIFIDEWMRLFEMLAARHAITGVRRFSRAAFERQLKVPGLVMFRASAFGQTVGLDLWFRHGDCVHNHLTAFDAIGYELHASYAAKWRAIEYFQNRVRWINLGAGTSRDPNSGLSRFKRGWATGTRTAWLCGRVLQPAVYDGIVKASGTTGAEYFPAYRMGEFV